MEIREKIAYQIAHQIAAYVLVKYEPISPINFYSLADQTLALIQGEWLDKPDSEGWWWFSHPTNKKVLGCIQLLPDVFETAKRHPVVFQRHKWCKAIVPQIGQQ